MFFILQALYLNFRLKYIYTYIYTVIIGFHNICICQNSAKVHLRCLDSILCTRYQGGVQIFEGGRTESAQHGLYNANAL